MEECDAVVDLHRKCEEDIIRHHDEMVAHLAESKTRLLKQKQNSRLQAYHHILKVAEARRDYSGFLELHPVLMRNMGDTLQSKPVCRMGKEHLFSFLKQRLDADDNGLIDYIQDCADLMSLDNDHTKALTTNLAKTIQRTIHFAKMPPVITFCEPNKKQASASVEMYNCMMRNFFSDPNYPPNHRITASLSRKLRKLIAEKTGRVEDSVCNDVFFDYSFGKAMSTTFIETQWTHFKNTVIECVQSLGYTYKIVQKRW